MRTGFEELTLSIVFSYLDRANIGNAKIEVSSIALRRPIRNTADSPQGLTDDLKLSGIQYNVVLSGFFITYVIFGKSSQVEASRDTIRSRGF